MFPLNESTGSVEIRGARARERPFARSLQSDSLIATRFLSFAFLKLAIKFFLGAIHSSRRQSSQNAVLSTQKKREQSYDPEKSGDHETFLKLIKYAN